MNTLRNAHPAAVVSALSLFLLPATQAFSQTTATTDPVGYTALPLQANSDTVVSIPFTRPAAFVGAIGSISSTNGVATITTASSPGWTAGQYKYGQNTQPNTYYAIIGPNLATISGTVSVTNGSTAVTATAGLSSITAGDELIVNGLAYNVASVTNDTALVLSRAFTGSTASGQSATYDHSPREGVYYTVTDNGTNTLTVNLNGDSLSTVTSGTTVSLIPYWTLITAFPATDAGISFTASTSTKSRGTLILLPDQVSTGTNLAPTSSYYFLSGAWVSSSTATTAYAPNDTILPPTTYFIVRNVSSATTFTPTGNVVMNRISAPFDAQAAASQDTAIALPRPTAFTLSDSNLISSGAFTPGTSTKNRGDLLLTFDNTTVGVNKAPTGIYYYLNNMWNSSTASGDAGSTTIPYGTGFTIRKAANTTGATTFWQNTRNY